MSVDKRSNVKSSIITSKKIASKLKKKDLEMLSNSSKQNIMVKNNSGNRGLLSSAKLQTKF